MSGTVIQLSEDRFLPNGMPKPVTRRRRLNAELWPLYAWLVIAVRPLNLGVGNTGRRWFWQQQTEQVVKIYRDAAGRTHYVTEPFDRKAPSVSGRVTEDKETGEQ